MLKIGIIGAARIGNNALLAPARTIGGCVVSSVAARDPARARDYAAAHGIPNVHVAYESLIADPSIDLVYVATPPFNHAELARSAVAAGKPVLVEKPFAMNAAEAESVYQLARRSGVAVFEAMHSPHHPLLGRVRELLETGAIGEVRRIDARFNASIAQGQDEYRWRPELGGGALMDLGVYLLAWCRRLAGEAFEVRDAQAEIEGVDTSFNAHLHFATGIEATITSSLFAERYDAVLTVTGSAGRLSVENFLAPHRGHRLIIERPGMPLQEEAVEGPSTYEAQLEAVRATLVDGRPFPFPEDDYVCSMIAIDRVRSAWESR